MEAPALAIVDEGALSAVDTLLREWLGDPDITLICGRWADGTIMELMPEGNATLTDPAYSGPFAGLRDLRLRGQAHHMHLDLAKLSRVVYAVVPSVCYGFRPSFEVRLGDDDAAAMDTYGLAISVRRPYAGEGLAEPAVVNYFKRALDHARRFPDRVRFRAEASVRSGDGHAATWHAVGRCLLEADGRGVALDSPRTASDLAATYRALVDARRGH